MTSTHFPVFAFDQYFNQSELADNVPAQMKLLRETGYELTYHAAKLTTPEGWQKFLAHEQHAHDAGLSVVGYLAALRVGVEPEAGEHSLMEMLAHMPENSWLDLLVTVPGAETSDPAHDSMVIDALAPLLHIARERNITIGLYPHIWLWMERVEDAVRLAATVDDPHLRVVFAGFHWYAVDGEDLEKRIALAAPYLGMANVCGSRKLEGEQPPFTLPCSIETVGEGDFPLVDMIAALRAVKYSGLVGFLGYQIGGEPADTLARSLTGWRKAENKAARQNILK